MKLTAGLIVISVLTMASMAFAEAVEPVAMNNRTIGGSGIAGSPTKGVENGTGLHNIGLLVKTFGKVTYRDPGGKFFYIDDGSALKDGFRSDAIGIRVSIDNLASGNSITMPDLRAYVSVVGVSSTFLDSASKIRPNLRPRNNPDVVTLQNPPAG